MRRRINSSNLLLGTVIFLLPTIAYASENVELLMMLGGVIAFGLGV